MSTSQDEGGEEPYTPPTANLTGPGVKSRWRFWGIVLVAGTAYFGGWFLLSGGLPTLSKAAIGCLIAFGAAIMDDISDR